MKLGKILILSGTISIVSSVVYHIMAGLLGFARQIVPYMTPPGWEYCHICEQASNVFLLIAGIGFLLIISGGIIHFATKRKTTINH